MQSSQDIGIVMGNHDFITTQELFQIIMVFAKHFLNMLKFLSVSDRKIILNKLFIIDSNVQIIIDVI